MPFRHDDAETEKMNDDDEKEDDVERRTPVFKLSTSVFKFGQVKYPVGKPMTRSQRKASEEYELSEQISKLRKVAERASDVRRGQVDDVEPDVEEPGVVEPVVDEASDAGGMYDEPYDHVAPSVPSVNLDPENVDRDQSGKRKRVTVEKKKRGRPRKPTPEIVHSDEEKCPICKAVVGWEEDALQCEDCETWTHTACLCMSTEEYADHGSSENEWFCDCCLLRKSNNVTWGDMVGELLIKNELTLIYDEIIRWKKNLFQLPRGGSAEKFIKELTRLIYLFVNKTAWKKVALQMVHVFIPLMLQKPSINSKARDHSKYLLTRLQSWKDGDLKSLMEQNRAIQRKVKQQKCKEAESKLKGFSRLMMIGKVGQAMKLINNEDSIVGVHNLNREIKGLLLDKHPAAQVPPADILLPETEPEAQSVIFEAITAEIIEKAAHNVSGSGGPTHIDSDGWKQILCSKQYGKLPFQLCGAVSELAKQLCTEEVDPECLNEFVACRLVPLDKGSDRSGKPGVRPIGIGEVLRRIVGKAVIGVINHKG